ncbi:MAG: carbohydrate kinase [Bacteroidales bacterium]|nr:carbohydrate kinase [Bacteroidales bacterium]
MSTPKVIGLGEYLWDMLPDGKKAGGAPVNFAYHAARCGMDAYAVTAVGNDELGRELIAVAKEHGIKLMAQVLDYPTGTVQVEIHDGQPSYTICENVAWDHIRASAEVLQMAASSAAICFGSLAQRSPESREAILSIVAATPEDSYRVFDINLRQQFYSKEVITCSLSAANVLKINDEELEILRPMFGLQGLSEEEACRALMKGYKLMMVILTAGSEYSLVVGGGVTSRLETPKVKVVDTVGAGDSFTGALIASLVKGATIQEAHRMAVDTAAEVCTHEGAWTK